MKNQVLLCGKYFDMCNFCALFHCIYDALEHDLINTLDQMKNKKLIYNFGTMSSKWTDWLGNFSYLGKKILNYSRISRSFKLSFSFSSW